MITEIGAGLNSLKAAIDLAIGLQKATTQAEIQSATAELLKALIQTQQAAIATLNEQQVLTDRCRELERQLAQAKDWDEQKARYEPKAYHPGVLVYELKADRKAGEPDHQLCAGCYEAGKRGFLQATTRLDMRYRIHLCTGCGKETAIGSPMDQQA